MQLPLACGAEGSSFQSMDWGKVDGGIRREPRSFPSSPPFLPTVDFLEPGGTKSLFSFSSRKGLPGLWLGDLAHLVPGGDRKGRAVGSGQSSSSVLGRDLTALCNSPTLRSVDPHQQTVSRCGWFYTWGNHRPPAPDA